jgi:hypothetical protein
MWHIFPHNISTHGLKDIVANANSLDLWAKKINYNFIFFNFLNFFLKDWVFIFIERLDSSYFDM